MPRRIDPRLGAIVLLAVVAAFVTPLSGVRVHHHLAGDHFHVHLEDVRPHGPHVRADARHGVHTHTAEGDAGAPPSRVPVRRDDGRRQLVAAPAADGHLHTFDPFLRAMRIVATLLAVTLVSATVQELLVPKPCWRTPVARVARGPPLRPSF